MADPSPAPPEGDDSAHIHWPPPVPGIDLGELQAEGGFGEIYRAAQLSMDRRPACCKLLNRRSLDQASECAGTTAGRENLDGRKLRLAREALLTASLDSRYIPSVYCRGWTTVKISWVDGETHEEKKWPYFVMEWIDGPRLGDFLTSSNGPWPCDGEANASRLRFEQLTPKWQNWLQEVFTEIARGLADAHERGVAHLDVKPANVLLKHNKEVKVIDWGMAWDVGQNPKVPLQDTSLDYMAPEQGVPGATIDFRADVYALGAIGHLLLTGEPFRHGTKEQMRKQMGCARHHEAQYERLWKSRAPAFWVKLMTACLQQDPAGRPVDARAVVREIANHRAALEQEKRDAENREREAKEKMLEAENRKLEADKRTTRILVVASAVVVIVLIAGLAVGANSFRLQAEVERNNKELAQEREKAATKDANNARLASQRFQMQTKLSQAFVDWYKGNRAQAKINANKVLADITALANDNPDDAPSRLLLAYAHETLGEMITGIFFPNPTANPLKPGIPPSKGPSLDQNYRQTMEEALLHYGQAKEIFQGLRDNWPDQREYVEPALKRTRWACANILFLLARFTEALIAFDEARSSETDSVGLAASLTLQLRRFALLDGAQAEQSRLPWSGPAPSKTAPLAAGMCSDPDPVKLAVLAALAASIPRADHGKAVKYADILAKNKGVSDTAVYNAACVRAIAAGDPGTTPEVRKGCEDKAMEYLKQIEQKCYFHDKKRRANFYIDIGGDLSALGHLSEFKELFGRVDAK